MVIKKGKKNIDRSMSQNWGNATNEVVTILFFIKYSCTAHLNNLIEI